MQAVILCAGKGTRLRPLTESIPKALVPVNQKPLIEYILDNLKGIVDEAFLVVGYLGDMVKEHLGESYEGIRLHYITQEEQLGTGHALMCAQPFLEDQFMVLNGDDIYHQADIQKLKDIPYGCLARHVDNPSAFGVFVCDENDKLVKLVEKPKEAISTLANIGAYKFDTSIFNHVLEKSARGEYEIVDYINYLIEQETPPQVMKIEHFWLPVNNHDQRKYAQDYLDSL